MGRLKGKIYPHHWKTGPDPVDHKLFNDWMKARAQAHFRGEEWMLTEQEYIDIWREDDRYKSKGRSSASLCLVRDDLEGAWHTSNIMVITRLEHLKRCANYRKELGELKRVRSKF
jgi:hypothetical protein